MKLAKATELFRIFRGISVKKSIKNNLSNYAGIKRKFGHHLFFFLVLFGFSNGISGASVIFLPVSTTGNIPHNLAGISNLSTELSLLQSYYAAEYFRGDFSGKPVPTLKNKKPDKNEFKQLCNRTETNYIVFSELYFGNKLILYSEVMNCRTGNLEKKNSNLGSDYKSGMQKFIKDILYFFPPINKHEATSLSLKKRVFVIDYSASLNREIAVLKNYFYHKIPGLKTGALIIRKNEIKYFEPKEENSELLAFLNNRKPSGDVTLSDINAGLFKLLNSLTMSNSEMEVILVTDAKGSNHEFARLLSVIRSVKSKTGSVKIITGSYFNNNELNQYKKSARAGGRELFQLTHYQKIGTVDGYKYLYLHNLNLYFSGQDEFDDSLDMKKFTRVAPSEIFSRTETIRPEAMVSLYSEIYGQKILEKYEIQSNMENILDKFSASEEDDNSSPNIMIRIDGQAILLNLPAGNSITGKEVIIKTRFVTDHKRSYGFRNVLAHTTIYSKDAPTLI